MTLPKPGQLIAESFTLPKNAARRILGAPVGAEVAVAIGLLAIICGILFSAVLRLLFPFPLNPLSEFLLGSPIFATALQFSFFVGMSWFLAAIGRGLGGSGNFAGALKLMAWLQVMMLLIEVVQFLLLLLLPVLGALVSMASVLWFFWALAVFTAELHGFRSVLKVMGMIFISLMGFAMILGILLALLGVQMPEMN